MRKNKLEIITIVLYIVGGMFFIGYLFTQEVIMMAIGALFLCYGSMMQNKKVKDDKK
ncbi:hypothetical protein ACWG0P_08045 [Amedibacillus sp. YH-ame6]